MTEDILRSFVNAMDEQDVDKIASFFTNDCIYKASVGPEPGKTYTGKVSVMDGIREMINLDSGGTASVENIKIYDDFGVYEWTYVFKDKSMVFGCDLLEFNGNKIKMINAYRKTSL